jgi:hypothetical protein
MMVNDAGRPRARSPFRYHGPIVGPWSAVSAWSRSSRLVARDKAGGGGVPHRVVQIGFRRGWRRVAAIGRTGFLKSPDQRRDSGRLLAKVAAKLSRYAVPELAAELTGQSPGCRPTPSRLGRRLARNRLGHDSAGRNDKHLPNGRVRIVPAWDRQKSPGRRAGRVCPPPWPSQLAAHRTCARWTA